MESPSPDQRRHAINRLAQTRYVCEPAALEALALIATTDKSQTVRTAAMRAMGRSTDPMVAETALKIMKAPVERAVAAPDDSVREAAVEALWFCARNDALDESAANVAAEFGMNALRKDRSRNVRVAAARLLGFLADKNVLYALADSLEQRDFGVCYEAERSLMRLTGHTFDHNAQRWRAFLAELQDPFAERGALNRELDGDDGRQWSWAWWKRS